jgi:hypothetical protein
MKKLLMALSLAAVFIVASTACYAKEDKSGTAKFRPSLISRKGYWVIEQGTKNDKQVVVLYYNNENCLVRKETRSKKRADTRKAKVMRSLKRSLEEAIDWAEPI